MSAPFPPLLDKLVLRHGVNVRVRYVGPTTAPVVVLLHGFPEHWYAWRHQVQPLLQAGWRVVIPDLRGFARSDKPEGLDAYKYDVLAQDVVDVLDGLGVQKAALVGHDIGGVVGWYAAAAAPERFTHFVAISAPHPAVDRSIQKAPAGLPGLFNALSKLPQLGEFAISSLGYFGRWPYEQVLKANVREGALTEADLNEYREEWSREFGVRAILDWYRAANSRPVSPKADRVSVPTAVIWGADDKIVSASLADSSAQRGANGTVVKIPGAGHWPHLDQPGAVADAIIAHIGRHEVIHEQTRPPRW
jgi:pimeloyl-ACP methyl ester carboxylesterase